MPILNLFNLRKLNFRRLKKRRVFVGLVVAGGILGMLALLLVVPKGPAYGTHGGAHPGTGQDFYWVDDEFGNPASTNCGATATDTPPTRPVLPATMNSTCKTVQQAVDIATADGSTADTDVIKIRGENNAGTVLSYSGIDAINLSTTLIEDFNYSDCSADGVCQKPKLIFSPPGGGAFESWEPTNSTTAPGARVWHTAVWTGSEMIVWGGDGALGPTNEGGHYTSLADTWVGTTLDGTTPIGRFLHTAVWTGSEMIVWGGGLLSDTTNTGGRYNAQTKTWNATWFGASAPTKRAGHTAVWTGSEMIVWGGGQIFGFPLSDGGAYSPSLDAWSTSRPNLTNVVGVGTGAPSERFLASAVWTGTTGSYPNRMIVWGGTSAGHPSCIGDFLNSGGIYNAAADAWTSVTTTGAPLARCGHTAVWTGGSNNKMIIYGGNTASGVDPNAYAYDPISNSWTTITAPPLSARYFHTAVWAPDLGAQGSMIVWGGTNGSVYFNDGAYYNVALGTWTMLPGTGAPPARKRHTAVWATASASICGGSHLVIWGGEDAALTRLNTGGKFPSGGSPLGSIITVRDDPSNPGDSVSDVTIQNLTLENPNNCGYLVLVKSAANIERVTIKNMALTGAKTAAIRFDAAGSVQDSAIVSNTITGTASTGTAAIDLAASSTVTSTVIDRNTFNHRLKISPQATTLTVRDSRFTRNIFTSRGISITARDPAAGAQSVIRNNTFIQNEIRAGADLQGILLDAGSEDSVASNTFIQNATNMIFAGFGFNSIELKTETGFINGNSFFGNTLSKNESGIFFNFSPTTSLANLLGNKLRNNIFTTVGIAGIRIRGTGTPDPSNTSRYNFYTLSPATSQFAIDSTNGDACTQIECFQILGGIQSPYENSVTPANKNFYLASRTASTLATSTLGTAAGSGLDGILGTDDDRLLCENGTEAQDPAACVGIISVGAHPEFIINQNANTVSDPRIASNSVQLAHDNASLSGADTLAAYAIRERGGTLGKKSGFVAAAFISLNDQEVTIQTSSNSFFTASQLSNKAYVGQWLYVETGANAGKSYLITSLLNDSGFYFDSFQILDPYNSVANFAIGDTFSIFDRAYSENLSGDADAAITFTKKGNPGWPITFEAKVWDKTGGTGPPMVGGATLNNFTGFETGGLEEEIDGSAGSAVIQSTPPVRTGTYSLALPGNSTVASYDVRAFEGGSGDAGNDLVVGFYFRANDTTPSIDVNFLEGRAAILNRNISLRLKQTTGDLVLLDAIGVEIGTILAPFTANTWHLIEIRWRELDLGTADISIDGVVKLSVTGKDFLNSSVSFDDPGALYRFNGGTTPGEDIYIDDVYMYSGASGTGDFLGDVEVFTYQNTLEDALDLGSALDSGTWANVGETPRNDATFGGYTSAKSGGVTTDEGPRAGPAGDVRIDGDANIKGAKWIHRLRRSAGSATNHYKRYGNNVDGMIDGLITLSTDFASYFTVSESETLVPKSTEYFQHGMRRDTGGQNIDAGEIWATILHRPSTGGATWSSTPTILLDAQSKKNYNIKGSPGKCLVMKGFRFLNALLGKFTGDLPTQSGNDYTWPCTPYNQQTLTSSVFDSGKETGVTLNSFRWRGSLPSSMPATLNRDVNKGHYVGIQIAASANSSGPWTFYGDPTISGTDCGNSTSTHWYYSEPSTSSLEHIWPIRGACTQQFTNKRYFKYRINMTCLDHPSSTVYASGPSSPKSCPDPSDVTAKLEDVILNFSR